MPAILNLRPSGLTGAMVSNHPRKPGKRTACGGWSAAATRRNTAWLRSVEASDLPPLGLAATLTLRDCPPDSDEWHRIRLAWMHRVKRIGSVGIHWVTEWQRRGVPHLHCALTFDADPSAVPTIAQRVRTAWLAVAGRYGASRAAQYLLPITDPRGWFQYVSKHASRGVRHYQRSGENVPAAWQSRTGRMWGAWGHWPLRETMPVELDDAAWWAFRRIVRRWRMGEARALGDRTRFQQAQRMLRGQNRQCSAVRGVSEWIDLEAAAAICVHLAAMGHSVTHPGVGGEGAAEGQAHRATRRRDLSKVSWGI